MSVGVTKTQNIAGNPTAAHDASSSAASSTSPILRSATFMELATEALNQDYPLRKDGIRRSLSENLLATSTTETLGEPPVDRSGSPEWSLDGQITPSPASDSHPRAHATPDFAVGADQPAEDPSDQIVQHDEKNEVTERRRLRRSLSGSITKLARRSWIKVPRSPSPSTSKRRSVPDAKMITTVVTHARPGGLPHDTSNANFDATSLKLMANGVVRRPSLMSKKSRQQITPYVGRTLSTGAPIVPPLPKYCLIEKLPSLKLEPSDLLDGPTVPISNAHERLQGCLPDIPRRRDELWNQFRNLDNEYIKFQSRPTTAKTAVIRSTLLPFLRSHAEHPSNVNLRPEDVDRRTVILNKWWTGLLEMLNGRHGESVSGNDRPAVLDAALAIMVRPEWIVNPVAMLSKTSIGPRPSLNSNSTSSLGSSVAESLVDSVFCNVRNAFTRNLLAQMAYVVQKMSTRNIPASVVAFCGQAIAYAFFYCDGIASILVRLWDIPAETLRSVLSGYGASRVDKTEKNSDRFKTAFPPCLHHLMLRSVPSMMRFLRSRPRLSASLASIPWHGPWVGRWAGRDTDLFYVFIKHISDLVCRHLPDDLSPQERIAAPGWALVQAQLLRVVQRTIKRVSVNPKTDGPSTAPPVSSEDPVVEAEAAITVLPLASKGLGRSMAENRIIMLLRDCLGNTNIMTSKAQSLFADGFDRLLKAAALRISIFDQAACFTLCDFLEEAIAIQTRYYHATATDQAQVDWVFWFDVCKKMLQSQNSMTEVRAHAFLYVMWPTITQEETRKHDVCMNWLLTKETFHEQFNHWCPMVRAYFMRLLIWRVARPCRQVSAVDRIIIETLSLRLQENWSTLHQLQEHAKKNSLPPPSTQPSSPAPSRQLLILRDDVQPTANSTFMSFENILSSSDHSRTNTLEKHMQKDLLRSSTEASEAGRPLANSGKKTWDMLKNLVTSSASSGDQSRAVPDKPAANRNQPSPPPPPPYDQAINPAKRSSDGAPPSNTAYRHLSFNFSLERVENSNYSNQLSQRLLRPTLPHLAVACLQSHPHRIPQHGLDRSERTHPASRNYVGRALAEWGLLVVECNSFFERRRAEGVPDFNFVETPTLNVDSFRKP